MVAEQLVAKGIQDARVIAAMQQVPRHLFIDAAMSGHAYLDKSLPIGAGQTISQPYMVARMTQMLRLRGHERVLEIGTGCGYQTAVLSCLCRRVYSIERIPALLERARANLRTAHHANVMLKCADGTLGWPEYAPFDAILAAAGGESVPDAWPQQLRDGGIIVMPLGGNGQHILIRRLKHGSQFSEERFDDCCFVPLVSEEYNQ